MNSEAKIVDLLEDLLHRHLWMVKETVLKKIIVDFKSELTLILKPIASSETTPTQLFDQNISQESISSDVSLLHINKPLMNDFSPAEESRNPTLKTPDSLIKEQVSEPKQQRLATVSDETVQVSETSAVNSSNMPIASPSNDHISSPPIKKPKLHYTEINPFNGNLAIPCKKCRFSKEFVELGRFKSADEIMKIYKKRYSMQKPCPHIFADLEKSDKNFRIKKMGILMSKRTNEFVPDTIDLTLE